MVLAEVGAGTLLRALVLALVLVTPYFLVTRRKVRAARAAIDAVAGDATADDGPPPPDPQALETVMARIDALAGSLDDDRTAQVTVPEGATVDGRPVAGPVRDAVLADALARSGLVEVSRHDDAGHLVVEVRRA